MVFAATLLKTMCVCVSEREREGEREWRERGKWGEEVRKASRVLGQVTGGMELALIEMGMPAGRGGWGRASGAHCRTC